jgi:hypothetical protein
MDARLIELGASEEQRCAELDLMVAQSYDALKNAAGD